MKIEMEKRDVHSHGEISSKKITLSANSKAFKIIFGQIYPNIIKAIVRELFTNAWDSQKNAGTLNTPIDIHLPTAIEPYFSIRDYGTGMTPDIINDVYTNVFESTKDKSNDEAGLFGMGSKTPLGLVDAFTVISYVNGTFWYYEIFLDNSGEPVLSLKATGKTDERNGVLVQLSVKQTDFDEFKTHAEHFAFGANTPININKKKYMNEYIVEFEGDGWQIIKSETIKSAYIRMGCVLYRLEPHLLSREEVHNFERNFGNWHASKAFNQPLIMDFDIGSFEVTGSRESIIYNRESSKKILDKILEIKKQITPMIVAKCEKFSHYFDTFVEFNKFKSNVFVDENVLRKILKHKTLKMKSTFDLKLTDCLLLDNSSYRKKLERLNNVRLDYWFDMYGGTNEQKSTYVMYYQADEKIKYLNARIKSLKNVYSLRNRGFEKILIVKYKNKRELLRLMAVLPSKTFFIHANDVIPEIEESIRHGKEKAFMFDCVSLFHKDNAETFIAHPSFTSIGYMKHDIEEGSYYIPMNKNTANNSFTEIMNKIQYLVDSGVLKATDKYKDEVKAKPVSRVSLSYYSGKKIYIVPNSYNNIVKKFKLVNLFELFDKEVTKFNVEDSLLLSVCVRDWATWPNSSIKDSKIFLELLKSHFKDIDNIDLSKFPTKNIQISEKVMKRLGELKEELYKFIKTLYVKYPLLSFMTDREIQTRFDEIMTVYLKEKGEI